MANSSAPGINRPKQRRSQETQTRLLRATRELIEETLFEDLTIQQIAARAGCSVGTFYGRFQNKDAILPCLLEAHYEQMEQEMDTAFGDEIWDGAPLARRVDAVVDHLMTIAQRQPGLIRTLVLRNNQRPDSIPSSIRAAAQRILARLYEFLLEGRSDMNHPAEKTAVEVGLLMVVSAIRERVILAGATHAATLSVSSKVLADELKHALLAYLTTPRI
jgi:AcrR family transcriptional regulator